MEKTNSVFKIVLVGDSAVGKSSMLGRYIHGDFYENFYATLGVDFQTKEIISNNKYAKLQIWDTAGQERYRKLSQSYFRNAHCYILMFDLSNKESFNGLDFWYNEIQNNQHSTTGSSLILLIGSKKDKKNTQSYAPNFSTEIQNFVLEKNLKYFEISSKLNDGIDCIFEHIVEILLDKYTAKLEPAKYTIKLESATNIKKTKSPFFCYMY
jgi:small GTP-binding protein